MRGHSESFGFNGELRQATGGQAFPQLVFDHWALMQGDPLEKGSKLQTMVQDIRKRCVRLAFAPTCQLDKLRRKGLKLEIPDISNYYDSALRCLLSPTLKLTRGQNSKPFLSLPPILLISPPISPPIM